MTTGQQQIQEPNAANGMATTRSGALVAGAGQNQENQNIQNTGLFGKAPAGFGQQEAKPTSPGAKNSAQINMGRQPAGTAKPAV